MIVGATALRPLVLVAGAGYAVATVLQLVQFGRSTNWLNGNGSTFVLLLGLAVELLVVGLSSRDHRPATTQADPAPTERWVPLRLPLPLPLPLPRRYGAQDRGLVG